MPDRRVLKPSANIRRRREGSGPKTSPGVEVPLVAPVFLEALETLAGRAETYFQGLTVGAGRREPREGTDSLDTLLVAAAGGVCVAGHLLKETTDVGAGSGVIRSTDVLGRRGGPVGSVAASVVGGAVWAGVVVRGLSEDVVPLGRDTLRERVRLLQVTTREAAVYPCDPFVEGDVDASGTSRVAEGG